jgi:hypothetical protein
MHFIIWLQICWRVAAPSIKNVHAAIKMPLATTMSSNRIHDFGMHERNHIMSMPHMATHTKANAT